MPDWLSLACLAVVLLGPLLLGVPIGWLLAGRQPLREADWLRAPFVGIGAVILGLQNLVYLDVPIRASAPWVWGILGVLWLWFLASGHVGASLRQFPWPVFALAIGVCLIQGGGMLALGARDYFGRGWWDLYWYVAQAEYFTDHFASQSSIPHLPEFITTGTITDPPTLARFGDNPLLFQGWYFAAERAGQGILLSFLSLSSWIECRTLLAPMLLLGPALLTLAVSALARRFGLPRGTALLAGLAAGVLPGVTLLQLEGVASQTLATPFLLFGVTALDEGLENPSWRSLLSPALLFGGMISIFPEFTLLLAGTLGLMLLLTVPGPAPAWKTLAWGVALLLAPFALNPGFTRMAVFIQIQRVVSDRETAQAINQLAYPWALQLEGLNRLWFGDLFPYPEEGIGRILVYGSAVLGVILAFAGLSRVCMARWGAGRALWADSVARRPLVLGLVVFGLAASPALLIARDLVTGIEHPYQFYKSLLALAPLLILGMALLVPPTARALPRGVAAGLLALTAGVGLVATAGMALGSTDSQPLTPEGRAAWSGWDRHPGRVLLTPEIRELRTHLEALPPCHLLLACPEAYQSCWLSYFARRHHVWLGNPKFVVGIDDGWCDLLTKPAAKPLVDLSKLPPDLLVLTYHKAPGIQMTVPEGARVQWKNQAYQIWQPPAGSWILPLRFETTIEPEPGEMFLIQDGTTTIDVFASQPTEAMLQATFHADPRAPGKLKFNLQVSATNGFEARWLARPGPGSLTLPVARGRTTITLTPAEPIPQVPQEDGTIGPALLTVEGLRVELGRASKKR